MNTSDGSHSGWLRLAEGCQGCVSTHLMIIKIDAQWPLHCNQTQDKTTGSLLSAWFHYSNWEKWTLRRITPAIVQSKQVQDLYYPEYMRKQRRQKVKSERNRKWSKTRVNRVDRSEYSLWRELWGCVQVRSAINMSSSPLGLEMRHWISAGKNLPSSPRV